MTHTFKLNSFDTWHDKFKQHIWKFYAVWLATAIYKGYTSIGSNDYTSWRILAPLLLLVIGLKDAFFSGTKTGSFLDIGSEMVSWKIRPVSASNDFFGAILSGLNLKKMPLLFMKKIVSTSF